ncbi:MAG: flagellar assembly peptidoglycan hydrolase FlgJ, partial [Gammaproteobacteria bacterium]|nr:flagellar assembly peptidoglycan hydrolase FlgJ [Gammaproteobacteria bacterium]
LNSLQNMPSFETKVEDRTNIYTDLNGLQNLKTSARKDANAALPEVARQFEAVMISMMIKNLRKTGMEDPIFKSQAMDSYRDMYDQQLGMELSKGQGIGFAKAIVEQMQYQSGQKSVQSGNEALSPETLPKIMPKRRHFPDLYSKSSILNIENNKNIALDSSFNNVDQMSSKNDENSYFESPEQFVETLWPLAEKAAKKLGVSPEIIVSQAALETGWGKYVISSGQKSSYNLFNIKANSGWSGDRVEKISTEFLSSKELADKNLSDYSTQQKSDFRVYNSFEQSFDDYTQFIQNNPRYNRALNMTDKMEQSLHDESYIKEIHKAGYATDPNYSNKVLNVLKSEPVQNQVMKQLKLASK